MQVNYLGHPSTSGAGYNGKAGFVDFIGVDKLSLPPDHASHASERLAVLPWNYMVKAMCTDTRRACGTHHRIADGMISRQLGIAEV